MGVGWKSVLMRTRHSPELDKDKRTDRQTELLLILIKDYEHRSLNGILLGWYQIQNSNLM